MADVPGDGPQTEILLDQLRAGDQRALNQLMAAHRAYLQRVVDARLDVRVRGRLDPSDLVQDAQMEAVRRIEAYLREPPMPFRLWLRRLAHDRVLKAHRFHLRAARRSVGQEAPQANRPSADLVERLLGNQPSPSSEAGRQELTRRVQDAVALLPDADRELLMLRSHEGLTFEEIAYLLEIEPAAARKRHGRALVRLGKLLAEGGVAEAGP